MAERAPASALPDRGDSGGAAVPAEPSKPTQQPRSPRTKRRSASPPPVAGETGAVLGSGVELWNRTRAEWLARAGGAPRPTGPRRAVLSNDVTYSQLLESTLPFPKPVPLGEVVDFLVECWVDDGLYAGAQLVLPPRNAQSALPPRTPTRKTASAAAAPAPVPIPRAVAAVLAQNALPPLGSPAAKRRGRPPGSTAAALRERAQADASAADVAQSTDAPPPTATPKARGRPRKPPAASMMGVGRAPAPPRPRGARAALLLPLLRARTMCAVR